MDYTIFYLIITTMATLLISQTSLFTVSYNNKHTHTNICNYTPQEKQVTTEGNVKYKKRKRIRNVKTATLSWVLYTNII